MIISIFETGAVASVLAHVITLTVSPVLHCFRLTQLFHQVFGLVAGAWRRRKKSVAASGVQVAVSLNVKYS